MLRQPILKGLLKTLAADGKILFYSSHVLRRLWMRLRSSYDLAAFPELSLTVGETPPRNDDPPRPGARSRAASTPGGHDEASKISFASCRNEGEGVRGQPALVQILARHFLERYFDAEVESGELRTGVPAMLGFAAALRPHRVRVALR